MKTDYIPLRDGDIDSFEENYEDKYPGIATALGVDAAEQTNTLNLIAAHRASHTTMVSKKAEKKAAVEDNTAKENSTNRDTKGI